MSPPPEDCSNLFQEGVKAGVKELFESYEDALLPTDVQLQKYKKRDLYQSHFHRTSCLVFGPRKHIRKSHIIDSNPFIVQTTHEKIQNNNELINGCKYKSKEEQPNSFLELNPAKDNKSWIKSRQKLRHDISQLDLQASWLLRKPERNCLENRVLAALLQNDDKIKQPSRFAHHEAAISSGHILPPHVSRIVQKVCNHFKTNNLLLSDVFQDCGKFKRISVDLCQQGLEMLVDMDGINQREADDVLQYFYKESEFPSLYTILTKRMNARSPWQSNKKQQQLGAAEWEDLPEKQETNSSFQSFTDSKIFSLSSAERKKLRIKEYESAMKMCQEKGVLLTETLLRKVLLHPGDKPPEHSTSNHIRQPGEILSKDFWKVKRTSRSRRHRVGTEVFEDIFGVTGSNASLGQISSNFEDLGLESEQLSGNKLDVMKRRSLDVLAPRFSGDQEETLEKCNDMRLVQSPQHWQDITNTDMVKDLLYRNSDDHTEQGRLWKWQEKYDDSSSSVSEELTQKSKSPSSSSTILFPRMRDVAPDRQQLNLSTGRAVVSRKVDCWMTYEEYEAITSSLEPVLRREKSTMNAFWPGHLLDKLRLCLTSCECPRGSGGDRATSKNALFQVLPHRSKRSNYGYHNNEHSWPTDGKYVKYGNVDQDKVYHL